MKMTSTSIVAKAEAIRATRQAERARHALADHSAEIDLDAAEIRAEAMAQAQRICLRVSGGALHPSVGLRLIENLSRGLDRVAYDRAVDFVAARFAEDDDETEAADWRVARSRAGDGSDAATRRARARSNKTGCNAGRITRLPSDCRARDPRAVTQGIGAVWDYDAQRWAQGTPNGEGSVFALPELTEAFDGVAGPVHALRPVWAVDASGVVDDAATVFGVHVSPQFGASAIPAGKGRQYVAKRNAKTGVLGAGHEVAGIAPGLGDGVAVLRDLGPTSDWRVASVPAFSPRRAEAVAWRAAAHDARLQAEARAEAYQRNGWAHGVASDDKPSAAEKRADAAVARLRAAAVAQAMGLDATHVCPECAGVHLGACH
jgi:hypothetical protein